MTTPSEQLNITDGPSSVDLVFALAKCYDKNPYRVKMMVYAPGALVGLEHVIAINQLGHEDGSGHKWLFSGFIVDEEPWQKIEGYFDSATRKGWLKHI